MAESPWRVTPSEVPRLIEAILNPQRLHSLTLVSPASDTGRPRLDVDALLVRTADLPTDVVLLDSMLTSERLSDSISSAFHCYGGSVRVVMPDARVTDHYRRHPLLLIYPDDDPGISLRRVVEAVERTPLVVRNDPATGGAGSQVADGTTAPAPVPGRPGTAPQPGGVPRPGPQLPGPGGAPRPGPVPRPGPSARPGPYRPTASHQDAAPQTAGEAPTTETRPTMAPTATPLHTTFGLADIEAVVGRAVGRVLEEQFGGPSAATEREQSRADTAEELLSEAENRIRRLETELQDRRESESLPRVFADEEQQLRWELEWLWLTSTPEQDRQTPLPAWTIGPDCIAGLATPLVPRRKTLLIMLAILQQKHWNAFETHQFLEAKAGRPRLSSEGTVIWRTYVKEKTPQAPRLTWWSTRTGGYHFEHVGAHDALL